MQEDHYLELMLYRHIPLS